MNTEQLNIVKSTAPLLKEHSSALGARFYKLLFSRVPALKNMFNQTNQKRGIQQDALVYAIYATGENINNLDNIKPLIMRVAEKHVALGVQPEHYTIVGETVLQAVKDVLGDAATDEIIEAWGAAYDIIADAFISIEKDMYAEKENTTGGWKDFRDFEIFKKVEESDLVTSFYLKPTDGRPVSSYKPGQYLTVKLDIEDDPHTHLRHYSLSDAPGKNHYRISVKREPGHGDIPDGIVSTHLHQHIKEGDILPFAVPAGDFSLNKEGLPIVLISGGIGLTPLISMLNSLVETKTHRPIIYIHATQNSSTHAMKDHIDNIISEHDNVKSYVVYDSPTPEDKERYNFDKEGFIDLGWLKTIVPNNQANFYYCGPLPFMTAINKALKAWNVPAERMHYEVFNPITVLDETTQPEKVSIPE